MGVCTRLLPQVQPADDQRFTVFDIGDGVPNVHQRSSLCVGQFIAVQSSRAFGHESERDRPILMNCGRDCAVKTCHQLIQQADSGRCLVAALMEFGRLDTLLNRCVIEGAQAKRANLSLWISFQRGQHRSFFAIPG